MKGDFRRLTFRFAACDNLEFIAHACLESNARSIGG